MAKPADSPTTPSVEDAQLAGTLQRLRRIEGQIRGIQRMLAEGRACEDVVTQLLAIRSGLDEVSLQILDLHIGRCILDGVTFDEQRRSALQETLRAMMRFAPAAPNTSASDNEHGDGGC
jgi:CsoR family transcriptional regulator, copper-sensing transcriptional repressor